MSRAIPVDGLRLGREVGFPGAQASGTDWWHFGTRAAVANRETGVPRHR